MKNKTVQYCVRLNLSDRDQLEIHKMMQDLDRNKYKSQNAFLIEVLTDYMKSHSMAEIVNHTALPEETKLVMKKDLVSLKEEIKQEIMQELFSMIMSGMTKSLPQANYEVAKNNQKDDKSQSDEEPEDDETLSSLSKLWAYVYCGVGVSYSGGYWYCCFIVDDEYHD